jgi:hypothetical protein
MTDSDGIAAITTVTLLTSFSHLPAAAEQLPPVAAINRQAQL